MLAHFVSILMLYLSRRDSLIVALRFDYTAAEYAMVEHSLTACVVLTLVCFAVEALCFFAGLSMFAVGLNLLHITCHFLGGMLLNLTIVNKGHYLYVWYAFAFFSAFPAVCEVGN